MMDEKKQAEQRLVDDFARWEYLYVNGGQDPLHADGVNLNLVRNHILGDRKALERLEYFPEIYSKEVPPVVDNNYMARADEIREHAKESLAIYEEDKDYKYLLENIGRINKEQAEKICLYNVLGYVSGLRLFIEKDSLVEMRRHENTERYLDSFRECRKRLEKIMSTNLKRNGTLTIVEEQTGQLRFA